MTVNHAASHVTLNANACILFVQLMHNNVASLLRPDRVNACIKLLYVSGLPYAQRL